MKIIIAVNYFRKTIHGRCLRGYELASDFQYANVLNIPGFCIYQSSEYARVLNILPVLHISGFWIYHGSMPGLHRVLNMPECAQIIPGYGWLCLNVPKSVCMAFVLHFLIIIIYLKEPQTVFLKSKNLIFTLQQLEVFDFAFCFRLNIFTSKISHLQLPWGLEAVNLDIPN